MIKEIVLESQLWSGLEGGDVVPFDGRLSEASPSSGRMRRERDRNRGWQSFSHSCIQHNGWEPVPVASQALFQVLGK